MTKFNREEESVRNDRFLFLYGITTKDYNVYFTKQEGCCAICGVHQADLTKEFVVNTCHTTDRVKGLLCVKCNSGLGNFKDSVEILEKAIKYLEV